MRSDFGLFVRETIPMNSHAAGSVPSLLLGTILISNDQMSIIMSSL